MALTSADVDSRPAAAPIPPSSQPVTGNAAEDRGLNATAVVLAAIGGGIGVLGFVAFFGAAILWARLDDAGLPGNEAVAVIPRSVLLSTGANFLVPSLLAALAFVALLYVIETATIAWSNRTLQKLETELAKREEIAETRAEEEAVAYRKAEGATQFAVTMQHAAKQASDSGVGEQVAEQAETAAETAIENAQKLRETAPAAREAERRRDQIKREVERERIAGRDVIKGRLRILRAILVIAAFLLGAVLTVVLFSIEIAPTRFLLVLPLMVGLGTVSFAILHRTDSFAWFALAVIAAVGILSGFLTYYRTIDHTKVEPAAVLRNGGAPVYGFFVAQTSDRIYLGTKLPSGDVRMAAIPRDEVTDLAVGDLERVEKADEQALALALQICRLARQRSARLAAAGPSADKPAVESCTEADRRRLLGA